jgi:hypothetical protein
MLVGCLVYAVICVPCSGYIYLLNVTLAGAGNGTSYGGTAQNLKVGECMYMQCTY